MNLKLAIKPAGYKGRGVFTLKKIKKGSLVLSNPVLYIKKPHINKVNASIMSYYAFYLSGKYLICLGEGCLLNHHNLSNLWYTFNTKKKTLDFYASRDISIKEELTIDYGWDHYPWG